MLVEKTVMLELDESRPWTLPQKKSGLSQQQPTKEWLAIERPHNFRIDPFTRDILGNN